MSNSKGRHSSFKAYTFFSIILSVIMVFTLFPQRVLAQETPSFKPAKNGQTAVSPSLTVTTGEATEITSDSAMLNGSLAGMGTDENITVYFEYGQDTSYGSITDNLEMVTNGYFFTRLMNLTPDTTYHYRAAARDTMGSLVAGEDVIFTTGPPTPPASETTTEPSPPETTATETTPPLETTTTEPLPPETTTTETPPDLTTTEAIPQEPTTEITTDTPAETTENLPLDLKPSNINPNKTTAQVDPDKETEINSPSGKIKVKFPKNAIDNPIEVEFTELPLPGSTGMQFVSCFELNASETDSKMKVSNFNKDIEISIQHTAEDLRELDIDSLRLFYLDETTRQWLPLNGSSFDKVNNILTANTNHFTHFGEMGNSLASGPGRIMGAQVGLQSGTAEYSYPLELPPGPGGFQPKLTLTYDSGSVDEMKDKRAVGSWVGIGWDLSLGSITLDTTTNTYYLKLSGASYELESADNINYRTNPDQYFKIIRSTDGNTWSVYDKDGYFYQFGGTSDSEQYYYGNLSPQTYYRWDISLMKDTNGNQATVTYIQDIWGNSVRSAYPQTLVYGSTQIVFYSGHDNDGHPDPTDGLLRNDDPKTYGYNPAPKMMENRKLNSIAVQFNGSLVRQYNFSYTETNAYISTDYGGIYYAGTLVLSSITQVGAEGSSALPVTNLTYQNLTTSRQGSESNYTGNPGNPASFSWPHLTSINNGYGGSVSFSYIQNPSTSVTDVWSREVVTAKTVSPGIGPNQTTTYVYTGNPAYLGTGWNQSYRGFGQVREQDGTGNYTIHFFYTTGFVSGKNTERLNGKEYRTQWYNSSNILLRQVDYNWQYLSTGLEGNYLFSFNNTPVSGGVPTIASSTKGYLYEIYPFSSSPICVFDAVGNLLTHFATSLQSPSDIAVSPDGKTIYVVDPANPYGYGIWITDATTGNGYYFSNYYSNMSSIDVSPDGNYIYVSSNTGKYLTRIQLSNRSSWGGTLNLNYYETILDFCISPDSNFIYVLGSSVNGKTLYKFDANTLSRISSVSVNNYMNNIFCSQDGSIYTTTAYGYHYIQKYDANLGYIGIINSMYGGNYVDVSMDGSIFVVINGGVISYTAKLSKMDWVTQLSSVTETIGSKTSTTNYTYDNYGNVVTEARTSSIPSENSTTYREFYPNTSANILDRVARIRSGQRE